jgi:hypothetical protein
MGRPDKLTRPSLEEAATHDEAEVSIWRWNTRMKTQAWTFLEEREWEAALVVIRNFGLSFWRRKVTISLFTWVYKFYPGRPCHVTMMTTWNGAEARYTLPADLRQMYRSCLRATRVAKFID